jgi:hypothetical protein
MTSLNYKMYAANGVGEAIEWDGENLIKIRTGMSIDKPIRVEAHRYHLFLAYRGGSLQHSSYGNPYEWDVVTGAGEINVGEEITDLLASVSGALTVLADNKVAVLFGDDSENWVLRTLSASAGGKSWTAQQIAEPIYMDNQGLRNLASTDQFGDFNIGSITRQVEPLFRAKQRAGVYPVASMRVREKDQYRLFFSDGTGLVVYFGRQPAEVAVFDLGFPVTSACSGKDREGREVLFFGDENGMVYQMDSGTSFDGAEFTSSLSLGFNHVGSPMYKKRWFKAVFEVSGGVGTEISVTANYRYSDAGQPEYAGQALTSLGEGGFSNPINWEGQIEAYLHGIGKNLSLTVSSTSAYTESHALHAAVIYYSDRGQQR